MGVESGMNYKLFNKLDRFGGVTPDAAFVIVNRLVVLDRFENGMLLGECFNSNGLRRRLFIGAFGGI